MDSQRVGYNLATNTHIRKDQSPKILERWYLGEAVKSEDLRPRNCTRLRSPAETTPLTLPQETGLTLSDDSMTVPHPRASHVPRSMAKGNLHVTREPIIKVCPVDTLMLKCANLCINEDLENIHRNMFKPYCSIKRL